MRVMNRTPRFRERGTMTDRITPATLAAEIGIDAKSLRGYLRKEFSRPAEVKNTSWIITPEAADAAREHFAKQETPTTDEVETPAEA